ncbi:UDP-3-O-(3-hydroxymyristoyl)glucosamine N-acyltransferase [soil metagenome]
MSITVRELAEWVEGELLGDGDLRIDHARPLADAEPGDITFVEDDRHLNNWHHSRASAAIVRPSVPVNGRPIIRVDDPLMAFASVMKRFRGESHNRKASIHPTSCVHPSATIGADANIGPYVVVGAGCVLGPRVTLQAGVAVGDRCRIGADVTLHPHVVLYDDTILGDRVSIHANTVIGADGYGYRITNGKHIKVPQLGYVEVGNDVEIGSNTTIDRGTFGPTRIGEGTKIDNLVMIGHNCQIGKHNLLVAQVGIAGSTTTGEYVVLAGQVGVADHITIGDRVMVGAQGGITRDIASDSRMLGTPARTDIESMRLFHNQNKLGDLIRDVKQIKKQLQSGESP